MKNLMQQELHGDYRCLLKIPVRVGYYPSVHA